jgi:membrane-associated phospholipid phosphatase
MRLLVGFLFACGLPAIAQMSGAPAVCGLAHPGACLRDVMKDQGGAWTSPLRLKPADAAWLLPLAGATALASHYDVQAQNTLHLSQHQVALSNKVANFGSPYATAGGMAGLYLFGSAIRNKQLAETGRLGAEAVVDVSVVVEALKLATNRQRLDSGLPGDGGFWPHGTNSFNTDGSFPSGHAAASWAMARVIASEYPKNKPVKLVAYTFATAISVCRITGRAHFPSDVVVGSALGYLVGGYVTRHHASEAQ